MANNLTTLPILDPGDLPSLDGLGVTWEHPPLDDPPDLGIPDLDDMTLADLAQRYAPPDGLATPTGKGRRPRRWDDPRILTMLGHLELGAYRTCPHRRLPTGSRSCWTSAEVTTTSRLRT